MKRRQLLSLVLGIFILVSGLYSAISFYFSSLILVAYRDPDDQYSIQQRSETPAANMQVLRPFVDAPDTHIWRFMRESKASKPNACAIVFVHGWGSNRINMEKFFTAFADTPCDFVTYDLRAHSLDPHRYSSGGIIEKQDLVAIHHFVSKKFELDDKQIGWFGLSMGGSTALQAAALNDVDPAFVIADSPYQDWQSAIFERGEKMYGPWVNAFRPGVNAAIFLRAGIWFKRASVLSQAQKIDSPVLLIHSAADSETSSTQSQTIFSVLDPSKSRFHHTTWGADHAKDIDVEPQKYKELIDEFLRDFSPQFIH